MLDDAIERIQPYYNSANFSSLLAEVDHLCSECLPALSKKTGSLQFARLLLLKISNLLVSKYQFIHQHKYLLGRPFGLLVDPSNSCPLRCPGCVHNNYFRQHNIVDWPDGLLPLETFDLFLRQFAPYALYMHFFNWGEPLLNRNTPKFIEMAKRFCLETVLSSNLNVKFDPEELVRSGLDFLIMSIDGATPETYQKYRRGGDFGRVINNVEKLVSAKKKYNMRSPRLLWQFLTFEHNVAEIPLAKEMAKNLGVDVITFNEPYDVSWADPTLYTNKQHLGKNVLSEYSTDKGNVEVTLKRAETNSALIEELYRHKWQETTNDYGTMQASSPGNRCPWLYKNLVMDALGRILPCCFAPEKSDKYDYIFSTITPTTLQDHFNADSFIQARKNISGEKTSNLPHHKEKMPYCMVCNNRKVANIDTNDFTKYFNKYNFVHSNDPILSEKSINLLADWSC